MDLSIIVPCHNSENWIKPLLISLKAQTNNLNKNRELIFILDNCTDNTEQTIINQLQNSNWTYYIHKTNYNRAGLSRNKGLELASGKWIWFIDSDDWLIPDTAIDHIMSVTEKVNANIIRFKYETSVAPEPLWNPTSVWSCVINRGLIGNLKFNSAIIDEDFKFRRDLETQPNYKEFLLDHTLYYYNFPRENSITYNIRLGEQTNAF